MPNQPPVIEQPNIDQQETPGSQDLPRDPDDDQEDQPGQAAEPRRNRDKQGAPDEEKPTTTPED